MSLYDRKKLDHLRKMQGKDLSLKAGIKMNNYEYGRNKAKKIAISKALANKSK